MKAIFNPE